MNISFGSGFIVIPSKKEAINPDNIMTIREDDGKCSILMQDCICVENINAPLKEILKVCEIARRNNTNVEVTENTQMKPYYA